MALISERMELCGEKVLDIAGVVREAIFRQLIVASYKLAAVFQRSVRTTGAGKEL
jgi:hypothetical protein